MNQKNNVPVYLHGRGGHGKVVADALGGRPVIWTDDVDGSRPPLGSEFICAIGDAKVRERMGGTLTVIHPSAVVSKSAQIGQGVYIGAQASIGPGATIGRGVIVNTGAIVEHECVIEDYAHIAPGAVLCGGNRVGRRSLIGAGATVKPYLIVGDDVSVGCGAVVVKNVQSGETVAGVPARPVVSAARTICNSDSF